MSTPPDDLRSLPAHVAVWRLAWPMVMLGWIRALYLATDAWWVGKLGGDALSGLGAAAFAWWMVDQLAELAGLGTHARVAQAIGAGRRDDVGALVTQGLWVSAAVSCALAALGVPIASAYLGLIGLEAGDPVHARAGEVLGGLAVASLGIGALAVVSAAFRGLGQTRAALATSAAVLGINAAVSPLCIGAWGVRGAPLATGGAALLGAAIGLVALSRQGIRLARAGPQPRELAAIVSIGGPVAASGVAFSLVYVLLGRSIAAHGEANLGALAVGHRLESFAYLATTGMSVAAATLVGQHVGAGDLAAARRAMAEVERWTNLAMIAAGAVAIALAPRVFAAFCDDPAVADAGVVYLRTQALVWVFMGWEITYEGGCAGWGRTWPSVWVVSVGTAARLPLAWWMADGLGLGAAGIWAAIALSTAGKGVALRAAFRAMTAGDRTAT
jgi:putative MATE family efflux protein